VPVVPSFSLSSHRASEGVGPRVAATAGCWRLVLVVMRIGILGVMPSIVSKSGNRAPSDAGGSASGRDGIVNDRLLLRGHPSLGEAFLRRF